MIDRQTYQLRRLLKRASKKFKTTNPAELRIKTNLEKRGYTVLHGGWPDFLAYKNGKVRFIEVKPYPTGSLSDMQELFE